MPFNERRSSPIAIERPPTKTSTKIVDFLTEVEQFIKEYDGMFEITTISVTYCPHTTKFLVAVVYNY